MEIYKDFAIYCANINEIIYAECLQITLGRNNIILHLTRDGLTLIKKYFIEGREYIKMQTDKTSYDFEYYVVKVAYITKQLKEIVNNRFDFSNIDENKNIFNIGLIDSNRRVSLRELVIRYFETKSYNIDVDIFILFLKQKEKMLTIKITNDTLTKTTVGFALKTNESTIIRNGTTIYKQVLPVELPENLIMHISQSNIIKEFGITFQPVIIDKLNNHIELELINKTNTEIVLPANTTIGKVYFILLTDIVLSR